MYSDYNVIYSYLFISLSLSRSLSLSLSLSLTLIVEGGAQTFRSARGRIVDRRSGLDDVKDFGASQLGLGFPFRGFRSWDFKGWCSKILCLC